MDEISSLRAGVTLNNQELCNIFKCSPQGGMRRGTKTNTLVLVSNHVKSLYSDRWIGDVMHYTGMGLSGDQSLDFMQNQTLANSDSNGVQVHLFEVLKQKEYLYRGQVRLDSSPYQERQLGEDGAERLAWVFPIKLISQSSATIPIKTAREAFAAKSKKARKLTDSELREKAKKTGRKKPGSRSVSTEEFQRNQFVAEYAKRRADGFCELCGSTAPFLNKRKEPYLETHHVVWLAKGGEDTVENTVALCPNCHRKMHSLNLKSDADFLLSKLKEHEEQ